MDGMLEVLDFPQIPSRAEPVSYEYNIEDKPKRRIALYKTTCEIIYDNSESKESKSGS